MTADSKHNNNNANIATLPGAEERVGGIAQEQKDFRGKQHLQATDVQPGNSACMPRQPSGTANVPRRKTNRALEEDQRLEVLETIDKDIQALEEQREWLLQGSQGKVKSIEASPRESEKCSLRRRSP